MARPNDMHVDVVYTYAPETLISAGDFDALMKAKAEIDAAWAALAEIDNGVFAAPYKHIAPAIKALSEMLREWQAGYAIEARRVDEYRAARDEQAAIVADVDKSLAIAHKKIDEQKSELAFSRAVALNGAKVIAEYSDKCAKLELRSTKLNARINRMRGRLYKIKETYESTAKLHSLAYSAICDDDELAHEQDRICGAS